MKKINSKNNLNKKDTLIKISNNYSIKHLFPLIIFFFVSCKLLTPGGCTDESACNYNPDIYRDNGSCYYHPEEYNCDGECLVEKDCMNTCGGTLVDDCAGVCDGTAISTNYYLDADEDGLGFGEPTEFCDATVGNGWVLNSDDEDDACFSNIHD